MSVETEAGKRLAWPETKTGKRLAGCLGALPLGGEQERLPDGSLTELRRMRTYEIAAAIEAEARSLERERIKVAVEALRRHHVSGYEWEWDCAGYGFWDDAIKGFTAKTCELADPEHDQPMLDRAAVLAILAENT